MFRHWQEVLRREYTKSCDIWSIGVITYILLCGYPPFYGDNDTQIFESVRVGKFDFPSPEWDAISDHAKDFIEDLLQKDPMDRCVLEELLLTAACSVVLNQPPDTYTRCIYLFLQTVGGCGHETQMDTRAAS